MIRINRQTDYAVRVVLALAKREPGVRLSSASIGREMQIPRAFMARIVARLAMSGLIVTYPGREGGISLARPAEQTTLLEVVEAFEGRLCLSDCFDGGSTDCPFEGACPVRGRWGRVQAAMAHEMAAMDFASIAREELPLAAEADG